MDPEMVVVCDELVQVNWRGGADGDETKLRLGCLTNLYSWDFCCGDQGRHADAVGRNVRELHIELLGRSLRLLTRKVID